MRPLGVGPRSGQGAKPPSVCINSQTPRAIESAHHIQRLQYRRNTSNATPLHLIRSVVHIAYTAKACIVHLLALPELIVSFCSHDQNPQLSGLKTIGFHMIEAFYPA